MNLCWHRTSLFLPTRAGGYNYFFGLATVFLWLPVASPAFVIHASGSKILSLVMG